MKRRLVYAAILAGLLCIGWYLRHKADRRADESIRSETLPQSAQAKIIVDQRRHEVITVVRHPGGRGGVGEGEPERRTVYLPPTASFEVGKDGSIKINARQWGTETAPFVGVSFGSDIRLRAAAGINLLYWRRWEVGGGVACTNDVRDIRAFVHVSYNPYASYFVSVGIDNKQTAHLMAGLKF